MSFHRLRDVHLRKHLISYEIQGNIYVNCEMTGTVIALT